MATLRLKTNLRCGACVAKITPTLNGAVGIRSWAADVANPDKILIVEGDAVTRNQVESLLQPLGYSVLGEQMESTSASDGFQLAPVKPATYYPLLVILGYLLGATALVECASLQQGGTWDWMRAMRHFMAGFFLVFSFFKMLNIQAFADAYQGYDIVAARWPAWGWIYPFVELALGAAYLANFQPVATNAVTLVVMGVSAVGVIQSVLAKRQIRCACLGTVFNLPMSTVTIIEDMLMVVMALAMLVLPYL